MMKHNVDQLYISQYHRTQPTSPFHGFCSLHFLMLPCQFICLGSRFFCHKIYFSFSPTFSPYNEIKKKNSRNYCKQFIRHYRHKQVQCLVLVHLAYGLVPSPPIILTIIISSISSSFVLLQSHGSPPLWHTKGPFSS